MASAFDYKKDKEDEYCDFVRKNPDSFHKKDSKGRHPLHFVCWLNASFHVVKLVYVAYPQAIKHQTPGYYRYTPLHHAVCGTAAPLEVMEFLIAKYPEALKIKCTNGYFPLHIACICKAPLQVVELLARIYQEGLNEKDIYGRTPFDLAKEYKASQGVLDFLEKPNIPPTSRVDLEAEIAHHEAIVAKGNRSENPRMVLKAIMAKLILANLLPLRTSLLYFIELENEIGTLKQLLKKTTDLDERLELACKIEEYKNRISKEDYAFVKAYGRNLLEAVKKGLAFVIIFITLIIFVGAVNDSGNECSVV